MDAFATADDLAGRLSRTFTPDEQAWLTLLLQDASTYLREDVIGYQVWPVASSTFLAWPDATGDVRLPQFPVVSVDAVTLDDQPIPYIWRDDRIITHQVCQVAITFTYGFADPPPSLVRWTCVLVSQVLLTLEQQLGLTAGGLSSVALDDFKAAWADAGDASGITLSDRNIELIRERFHRLESHVVDLV